MIDISYNLTLQRYKVSMYILAKQKVSGKKEMA